MADEQFPHLHFEAQGYDSVHHGEGRWNGVAILSSVGIDSPVAGFADGREPDPDARIISARCGGVTVSSVYVPNGRAVDHEHYRYKLDWLGRLRAHLEAACDPSEPVLVGGDFNVCPDDRDVWDPENPEPRTHVTEPERDGHHSCLRLGPAGHLPRALRRSGSVQLVGLPRRRVLQAPRPAHRPAARHRAGRWRQQRSSASSTATLAKAPSRQITPRFSRTSRCDGHGDPAACSLIQRPRRDAEPTGGSRAPSGP